MTSLEKIRALEFHIQSVIMPWRLVFHGHTTLAFGKVGHLCIAKGGGE